MPSDSQLATDLPTLLLLVAVGAIANAINAVAGGGTLISFPVLVGVGVPAVEANATNAAAQWPGSLASGLGFWNLLSKTRSHLRYLLFPTLLGALAGAWLLVSTDKRAFALAVPFLILAAALMLAFQHRVKAWALRREMTVSRPLGVLLQFFVAVYGGYFGAGMGIMMLAAFALYIEGTIHELNAMKVWLGLLINLSAAVLFGFSGKLVLVPGLALAIGGIVGGFASAKLSQRLDSEKLRVAIAAYGLLTAAYFAWRAFQP